MSVGMRAYSLGPHYNDYLMKPTTSGEITIGIPFTIIVPTNATDSTYNIYSSNAPKKFRVIDVHGYMTGAGAASDTILLRKVSGSNITDTIDVSALADTDTFEATRINDANNTIAKGGSLSLVTASAALAHVYIDCVWEE